MLTASDSFKLALSNSITQVFAKIDLLDKNEQFLEEITAKVIDGNINVDKGRDTLRSFSLTVLNDDNEFTWSVGGKIWLDKRIKIWIGMNINNQIEWIPQGVFILTDISATSSATGERFATISGVDKWGLFSNPLGRFTYQVTINAGIKVSDAIKLLAGDFGVNNFIFDDCSVTVPYSFSYNIGDSVGKAIKDLADLAVYFVCFDVNGYMRFYPLPDLTTKPSVWTYDKTEYTLYSKSQKTLDHSELYNKILVIGGSSQTATVSAISIDNDSNSPTSTVNIGERLFPYNNGSPDPLITTTVLAQARADYELKNRLRIAEQQQMEIIPNYLHEVDDVITLIDDWHNTNDKYEIISFQIPLRPSNTMTMTVWKSRNIGQK